MSESPVVVENAPTVIAADATKVKKPRQVKSRARLQRLAMDGEMHSSGASRKAMMDEVKKRGYSMEQMESLWQRAIAIAKGAHRKTVHESDVKHIFSILDALTPLAPSK